MRRKTKTVMEQMNAEKPDDVLADLEAKHGSPVPIGSVILTVHEIRNLAMFAGLVVEPVNPHDKFASGEHEEEICVTSCPKGGVFDEDTKLWSHYKHVAYLEEYPEEGMCPLGPEIAPNNH